MRALLSHTLAGIEILASTVDRNPAPTQEQMFSGTDLKVSHAYVSHLRAAEDSSLFKPEVPAPANATATQELMPFLGRTVTR